MMLQLHPTSAALPPLVVEQARTLDHARRARLVRGLSLFILVGTLLFLPAHLLAFSEVRVGMMLVLVLAQLGAFALVGTGRVVLAGWLSQLSVTAAVGAVTATTGTANLTWVAFLPVAAFSMVVFGGRLKTHVAASVVLCAVCAAAGYLELLSAIGSQLDQPGIPKLAELMMVVIAVVLTPALLFLADRERDANMLSLLAAKHTVQRSADHHQRLSEELAVRSAEASAASEAKSAFLAHMSHEIRSPLAAVISLLQLARRTIAVNERASLLVTAERSAQHLLQILNDILDLSKVERGHLELESEPTDVQALVADLVALCRSKAHDKGIALVCEADLGADSWWRTDALRLRQVLLNLVGNAIKFTDTGEVRLRVSPQDQGLLFEVIDTGIGMTEDQLSRVFDAFQQADASTARRFGGTGLGLAISKEVVSLAGGQLEVESQPGQGSTFRFALPLQPAEPAVSMHPDAEQGDLAGLSVLVAEDHPVNQLIVRRMLESEGCAVEIAGDGAQAVQRAAEGFDIILLDVQMPVMDGMEAARRLRADGVQVPLIALTAHAMAGDRERCLAAGMDAHLTKPIDMDALRRTFLDLLGPGSSAQGGQRTGRRAI